MAVAIEIEALERRGWEALSGSAGADFYAGVMAEDGIMVFPGSVLDRAASLRAIAAAPPWSAFDLADLRVIELGPDSALVTYRASSRREGEAAYEALMTSVYARRDGAWKLVLHQQSPERSGG
jgi:uncharacterized protein (TIGR02246 family)